MSSISKLIIFISENEPYIQKDLNKLLQKEIFDLDEITSGDSLLICISRDYYDLPNETPAVMIRDQLSNVFCPKWRINGVKYQALLPIMNYKEEDLPEIYIITENPEIFDNIDYYLHLSKFGGRFKMLLSEKEFIPCSSQISRDDVLKLGKMTSKILALADYDKGNPDEIDDRLTVNPKQVPGWVFQCANDWLTRLLDLYDITPNLAKHPDLPMPYPTDRKTLVKLLMNPLQEPGPYVGEDIRTCIIEDYEPRRLIYELTVELLEKIGN